MIQNKIIFHLTNDKTAESCGAEQSEIERLVSQFNNGHLMFIVDFAAYRYEGGVDLPRHLQWRLHNLQISSKKEV